MKQRTVLLVAAVVAALLLASGVALAAATTLGGAGIDRVVVVRQNAHASTDSATFTDIPGASVQIRVPDTYQNKGLILARFSAESSCSSPSPPPPGANFCSVRLMAIRNATGAVPKEMEPVSSDFAFDSSDVGKESSASWESHSMDRSLELAKGTYTIKAQYAALGGANLFSVDDWSLTVERAQRVG